MKGTEERVIKVWQDLVALEMRIKLMRELGKLGVGLAEIENFGINLRTKLRSEKQKDRGGEVTRKVTEESMRIKMRDEQRYREELVKRRNQMRKEIERKLGKNTRPYRRQMALLKEEGEKIRREREEKYDEKMKHLKEKFRKEEEEKENAIPEELEEYEKMKVFSREKFDEIQTSYDEVLVVSKDVKLSEDEKSVLKLHTKFSVIQRLTKKEFEFEQEQAYAKVRMQRKKELEEVERRKKEEESEDVPKLETANDREKREEREEEEEALARQTFNPISKEYDDRKRRVTDLAECNRITLPQPLPVEEEALIEIRRNLHSKISDKHFEEKTENGEQIPNLSAPQKRGLDSLLKRIKAGEIIIMKTDKSGKFVVVDMTDYLRMGHDHTANDKKIDMVEVIEIEKNINGHSMAWCKTWGTGEDHNHSERVMSSRTTNSNNLAVLYPLYKDHKAEPGKTRPVVTGCSSNSRGLSNSVSNLLESVANCNPSNFESISAEDMLSKMKEHDSKIHKILMRWEEKREDKMNKALECDSCHDRAKKIIRCCQNCTRLELNKNIQQTTDPGDGVGLDGGDSEEKSGGMMTRNDGVIQSSFNDGRGEMSDGRSYGVTSIDGVLDGVIFNENITGDREEMSDGLMTRNYGGLHDGVMFEYNTRDREEISDGVTRDDGVMTSTIDGVIHSVCQEGVASREISDGVTRNGDVSHGVTRDDDCIKTRHDDVTDSDWEDSDEEDNVNQQAQPTEVNVNQQIQPSDVNVNQQTKPTDVNVNQQTKPTDVNVNQQIIHQEMDGGNGAVMDRGDGAWMDGDLDKLREAWDCLNCGEGIQDLMNEDCGDCGAVGVSYEELEVALLGLDVVSLFPNIKSKPTGEIVRKMLVKSGIKVNGMNWKQACRYIAMNRHLTGMLDPIRKFLPWRKGGLKIPSMKNKQLNQKRETLENNWCFREDVEPTEMERLEIAGRVAEIGTRACFELFTYKFGGEIFHQRSGGPIGARVTMCAARLVMQDWGGQVHRSLQLAKVEIGLLSGYVDDVRLGSTALRLGMRYQIESRSWSWRKEDMMEDKILQEEGENRDRRMARVCLPLLDSINGNLKFTTEVADDFANKRLPTLDFEMWLEPDGSFNHSYYQKPMKVRLLTMKNSAMSRPQKVSILSNEVVRRLTKVNIGKVEKMEVVKVMDNMTYEMKNSGYDRKETLEVIKSGMIGWLRKLKRCETNNNAFYKSAASTLSQRYKKKLLEKTNWYRKRKRNEEEEMEEGDKEKRLGNGRGKRIKREKIKEREMEVKSSQRPAAAVMFTPYTTNSALAKSMREAEEKLGELTGYKIKVVESAGTRLEDILHKSDPWQGIDCGRTGCLLCTTKSSTGKNTNQDCCKRSAVYEIWCRKCLDDEKEMIEKEEIDKEEKKRKIDRIRVFKYIGETSRSVFERAWEHQLGLNSLNHKSFMLKHMLDKHEKELILEKRHVDMFGIKVLKYTKTSFERQILESVLIQENSHHHILNSKTEYNRCAVPRLTSKLGENLFRKWEEDDREEKRGEEILKERIRKMRKERNRDRREVTFEEENHPTKRRKFDEDLEKREGDEKEKKMEEHKREKTYYQMKIKEMFGQLAFQEGQDENGSSGAEEMHPSVAELETIEEDHLSEARVAEEEEKHPKVTKMADKEDQATDSEEGSGPPPNTGLPSQLEGINVNHHQSLKQQVNVNQTQQPLTESFNVNQIHQPLIEKCGVDHLQLRPEEVDGGSALPTVSCTTAGPRLELEDVVADAAARLGGGEELPMSAVGARLGRLAGGGDDRSCVVQSVAWMAEEECPRVAGMAGEGCPNVTGMAEEECLGGDGRTELEKGQSVAVAGDGVVNGAQTQGVAVEVDGSCPSVAVDVDGGCPSVAEMDERSMARTMPAVAVQVLRMEAGRLVSRSEARPSFGNFLDVWSVERRKSRKPSVADKTEHRKLTNSSKKPNLKILKPDKKQSDLRNMFERQERVGKRKREEGKVAGEMEVGENPPKSVKKGVGKEFEKKRELDGDDGVEIKKATFEAINLCTSSKKCFEKIIPEGAGEAVMTSAIEKKMDVRVQSKSSTWEEKLGNMTKDLEGGTRGDQT